MVVVCLMIMVLNFIKPFFATSVYFYEKGFFGYTLICIALVKSTHSAVTGASMKKAPFSLFTMQNLVDGYFRISHKFH